MPLAREIVEVLPIVLFRLSQDVSRGKTPAESGPRNSHAAEDETQVGMPGWSHDHRQQVAGHVDLPGPELNEGHIPQLREVAPEVRDHAPDDARIVVSILEVRRDRSAAAEQQPMVAGEPEI